MNTNQDKIKKEILNLTKALGFDCDLIIKEHDGTLIANLVAEQPGLLIGRDGETLFALQQIARLIIGKKEIFESRSLILDINNYRQKRLDEVEKEAKESVREVLSTKIDKPLPPMNSVERMIVHKIIGKHAELSGESEGEGLNRHIVIKYKNNEQL